MKYIMSVESYFVIEANNHSEAINKGWEYVYKNLPECFDTEGSELSYTIIED